MFPNLKIIRLDFNFDGIPGPHNSDILEAATFCDRQDKLRVFQRAVMHGLTHAMCPPSLKELALLNLSAGVQGSYAASSFQKGIIGNITALSLSFTGDRVIGDLGSRENLSKIWGYVVPELFLRPAQCLTSLTLCIDQDNGYIPCLSVVELHFPHLAFLSLRHMLFCHPQQGSHDMEIFIIRHKMTLQSLVLDSCAMYVDKWAIAPQQTWLDIWNRFEIELDKLRDLAVLWSVDADIPDKHKQFENTK
ncbi:hypothetical protein PILCRDRAFT_269305 [Piloderma croceum F 1598]|uniref:Uncharacterized protein n=1 Tax=Piloderma croceum (strain F 1598) TaxID=765440 RepID=A0A0C3GBN1_PILCF|nr:hypothetical protein PILCRDRAFT_269305 [Piloderma croceum F 1598]